MVAALGALGIFSPPRLLALVRKFQTRNGLLFAAAIRIVLGTGLYLTAPESLAPDFILVLGIIVFLAGVATPFIPLTRVRKFLDWWSSIDSTFVRVWAVCAAAFGLALAYAVMG
jgi:hypothetical protein